MGETAFFKMLRDEARPVYNVVAKSPCKRYFIITILLKAPVLIVLPKKLMSNIDLHYTNTRLGL